jgi:hypothetical protein
MGSAERVDCRGGAKMCREIGKSAAWASAAAMLLAAPAVTAEGAPSLLNDRFELALGTFGINSQPTIELSGSAGSGKVDFAEEIGGGDAFRARVDAQWRFAERHKVQFAAFGLNQSQNRRLSEDIDWGDATYPAGADVKFDSEFYVIQGVYDYSFLRRETWELGASIGLHWTHLEASLKAKAEASGGTLAVDVSESASLDAPLPVIGLRGLWSLTHDFWFDASAQFFSLSINEYDGNLQDYRAFVTWQPRKWLGVGVGYERFTVDVDVDTDDFNGSLDWTYDGPMIFYNASF